MIFTFGKGTGGGKGVYITVTCDSRYQGYNIICTTGSVSKSKTCGSNNTVQFRFSDNEVSTLPATFTISNNHPNYSTVTKTVTANIYGWYSINFEALHKINYTVTLNHAYESNNISVVAKNNSTGVQTSYTVTGTQYGMIFDNTHAIQENGYVINIRLQSGTLGGKVFYMSAIEQGNTLASKTVTVSAANLSYGYTASDTLSN